MNATRLTVVEWKDYHLLAVATVSDLQNSYCNQWPHPFEPQISSAFVFSANFTKIAVKCKQTAEKLKLFDFCDPPAYNHCSQYEFWQY